MPEERRQNFNRNHDLHTRSMERVVRAMADRLRFAMSNEELAEIACFSPCHFNRLFRRMTGIPPVQFHYALRVARAKELLIDTDTSVTEICFDVGYNSLGTFVSRFHELVGVSPNGFRRIARQIEGMCLADFPLARVEGSPPSFSAGDLAGTIERDCGSAVIFVGLFRQPIPVGMPHACTLLRDGSRYTLPVPPDGTWHVQSVAVPLTANGSQLLTLNDLSRGRGTAITVNEGHWIGDSDIRLSLPSYGWIPPRY